MIECTRADCHNSVSRPQRCSVHIESCVVSLCENPAKKHPMCGTHKYRKKHGIPLNTPIKARVIGGSWRVRSDGYVVKQVQSDKERRKIWQHVEVMETYLGRKLLPGENIHHKNGVRDDNRIENLELWSKVQPAGQRVVDKVAWAKEILETYEKDIQDGKL